MKTNKSYTKRLRVTKNGKIIARKPGQGHFNAKESGSLTMSKKRKVVLKLSKRITRRFLPDSMIDLSCLSVGNNIAEPIEGNDSAPLVN